MRKNCTYYLNSRTLCAVVSQEPPPDTPPQLRDAVRMTAKLGGFLGRKTDGEPGTITLWRGLLRLDAMVIGYRAGLQAAQRLHATAVKYPKPAGEEAKLASATTPVGMRIGILARDDEEEAWRIAHERFPPDRKGQITHQLAMKVSDSSWHRQLSELASSSSGDNQPYWLWPFENYKTFCPYLVGSFDRVGDELARYLKLGYRSYILDVPQSAEDLGYTATAFQHALAKVGSSVG